ncbi:hypothetical protein MPER_07081, partial [Moniliophthora perniciosa FA553]
TIIPVTCLVFVPSATVPLPRHFLELAPLCQCFEVCQFRSWYAAIVPAFSSDPNGTSTIIPVPSLVFVPSATVLLPRHLSPTSTVVPVFLKSASSRHRTSVFERAKWNQYHYTSSVPVFVPSATVPLP